MRELKVCNCRGWESAKRTDNRQKKKNKEKGICVLSRRLTEKNPTNRTKNQLEMSN